LCMACILPAHRRTVNCASRLVSITGFKGEHIVWWSSRKIECLEQGVSIKFFQDIAQEKKKYPSLNFIPYSRTLSLEDNPPDVVSATLQNGECCCLMSVSF